jgi:hypothetical protein
MSPKIASAMSVSMTDMVNAVLAVVGEPQTANRERFGVARLANRGSYQVY